MNPFKVVAVLASAAFEIGKAVVNHAADTNQEEEPRESSSDNVRHGPPYEY